jgi:hypothetical protein
VEAVGERRGDAAHGALAEGGHELVVAAGLEHLLPGKSGVGDGHRLP